jgi:hypothetical protein
LVYLFISVPDMTNIVKSRFNAMMLSYIFEKSCQYK